MDYPPRVYDFNLQTVGIVVGLVLLAIHIWALVRTQQTKDWLRRLPRSRIFGAVLLAIDALWTFWLVSNMDLGEFSQYRGWLQLAIPTIFFLTLYFANDFLAVRALGIFALLAAEPVLSAAFLRPERSRLLVMILAYVYLTLGLFWVGMPYLLRDQIAWLTKSGQRFRIAMIVGVIYGGVVLFCALTIWMKGGS